MTIPVSDITAVTPEGVVAPAAELGAPPGRGKRRRLRFVANAKAATNIAARRTVRRILTYLTNATVSASALNVPCRSIPG